MSPFAVTHTRVRRSMRELNFSPSASVFRLPSRSSTSGKTGCPFSTGCLPISQKLVFDHFDHFGRNVPICGQAFTAKYWPFCKRILHDLVCHDVEVDCPLHLHLSSLRISTVSSIPARDVRNSTFQALLRVELYIFRRNSSSSVTYCRLQMYSSIMSRWACVLATNLRFQGNLSLYWLNVT